MHLSAPVLVCAGRTAALLWLVVAAGCSQAQIGDPPAFEESGGPDAGSFDLGRDAGPGAPPDAAPVDAGPIEVTLSHSASTEIMPENSAACIVVDTGFHTENSYYRVFDLEEDLDVVGDLEVSAVAVGVEEARGNGGAQPIQVRLHALEGELAVENLTELAASEVTVGDQSLSLLEVPLEATVPAGTVLAAEVVVPDGRPNGHTFFIGSNAAGQASPTYFRASETGCEIPQPVDVANLGFPDMHLVLELRGTVQQGVGQ